MSISSPPDACVTIGNFDGLHAGHRSLIDLMLREAAQNALEPVLITFWPHPRAVLRGANAHAPLASRLRRLALLRGAGVERIVEIPFSADLAALSAEEFWLQHLKPLRMRELVIGHDFSLGRNREGNADMLARLAQKYGFSLARAPQLQFGGAPVSSTRIRKAIGEGDVAMAAALLGRPYSVCGHVARGYGRGIHLGFPTANLSGADCLLPGNGVYATLAAIAGAAIEEPDCAAPCPPPVAGGQVFQAVTNIGCNPTFGNAEISVESFLLDADLDLYGKRICLQFLARIRAECKFPSPRELAAQIGRDIEAARAIFAKNQTQCPS